MVDVVDFLSSVMMGMESQKEAVEHLAIRHGSDHWMKRVLCHVSQG